MAEYIEREAAIQALGDEPEIWYEYDPTEIQERNDWNYYKHCIEAVPAADVTPVRHGRWVFEPGKIPYCSECKEYSDDGDKGATICPWCGARMDKEAEYEVL